MTDGMYDENFDTKALDDSFGAWVEVDNWKDVTTRLRSMKFALQADRDKIPGILSELRIACPYSAFKRFPDKQVYSKLSKEAIVAVAQVQAASSFKRRADEKNAVSGLVTANVQQASASGTVPAGSATIVRPPRENDSAFQEDNFSFGKFDDAATAFHKALAYLEGLSMVPMYRRYFEKKYDTKWVAAPSAAAPSVGGTGAPAPGGGGVVRPNA
uniref:Capsid protein n=1 Tax=Tobacco rattle virus TaxID=12295 RepID=E6Y0J7_9VIRU|nr:capsid protein [Tobacco rattle virus]ABE27880.1 capsid protein [Tobacco rattle virus]